MGNVRAEEKIKRLEQALSEQKEQNQAHRQQIQTLMNQLSVMQSRLDETLGILYGQRSEKQRATKVPDTQPTEVTHKVIRSRCSAHNDAHPGRRSLPEHLPRKIIKHELEDKAACCLNCQYKLQVIGKVVSEQLDVVPAQFTVLEHRQYKYACSNRCHIQTAPMPAQPVDKGIASAGLLAHIAVAKYQDHTPLYRLALSFKRVGVAVAESTLCGWVADTATLLSPLVDRMQQQMVHQASHLFTDDTSVPVLSKHKTRQARLWVYVANDRQSGTGKTVIYQYSANRSGSHPQKFLSSFKGYLQADAYAGYDKLYRIEKHCHRLCTEKRYYYRRRHSKPVLKKFKRWLLRQQKIALPKTPIGKAIAYALNHWRALGHYLCDGRLLLDNNTAERAIKPVVMGRKNYLFAGSHEGGKRAAIIYSIIETRKLNGINTFEYLKWVLLRIPQHPNKLIDQLLPYNLTTNPQHWPSSPA